MSTFRIINFWTNILKVIKRCCYTSSFALPPRQNMGAWDLENRVGSVGEGAMEEELARFHVSPPIQFIRGLLRFLEIPVHGGYSRWSRWNSCSRQCGGGTQQRYRSCTNPRPGNGGRDCSRLEPRKQTRFCNTQRCPSNKFVPTSCLRCYFFFHLWATLFYGSKSLVIDAIDLKIFCFYGVHLFSLGRSKHD